MNCAIIPVKIAPIMILSIVTPREAEPGKSKWFTNNDQPKSFSWTIKPIRLETRQLKAMKNKQTNKLTNNKTNMVTHLFTYPVRDVREFVKTHGLCWPKVAQALGTRWYTSVIDWHLSFEMNNPVLFYSSESAKLRAFDSTSALLRL